MARVAISNLLKLPYILAANLALLAACSSAEQSTAPSQPAPRMAIQTCDSLSAPVGPDSTRTCAKGMMSFPFDSSK
jgi:hypothetical protein